MRKRLSRGATNKAHEAFVESAAKYYPARVYQGGIVEVNKRLSNHFSLLGNYTFSKAIDTVTDFNSDFGPQDNTDLNLERGLSSFDQRRFETVWRGRENSNPR